VVTEIVASLTRSGVPLEGAVIRPPSIVEVEFPWTAAPTAVIAALVHLRRFAVAECWVLGGAGRSVPQTPSRAISGAAWWRGLLLDRVPRSTCV